MAPTNVTVGLDFTPTNTRESVIGSGPYCLTAAPPKYCVLHQRSLGFLLATFRFARARDYLITPIRQVGNSLTILVAAYY